MSDQLGKRGGTGVEVVWECYFYAYQDAVGELEIEWKIQEGRDWYNMRVQREIERERFIGMKKREKSVSDGSD